LKNCLIIQTAFLGDVILATSLIEKLKDTYPQVKIDFLVRKENENLLACHPKLNEVLIWDKQSQKYRNLIKIIGRIRASKYDTVINLQRFASTGIMAAFSKGKQIIGFKENPFSWLYHKRFPHQIGDGSHEVERNQKLISELTNTDYARPKLYPSKAEFDKVKTFKAKPYVCLAPASVWETKQLPIEKWLVLIKSQLTAGYQVFLLGGPNDLNLNTNIIVQSANLKKQSVVNLAGQISLLESAALMQDAEMNFVNDSGPLHIASAMNAPVTAFFCSTIPSFGFGPLSDKSTIVEVQEELSCRPCGLHGKKICPLGHFKCGNDIVIA